MKFMEEKYVRLTEETRQPIQHRLEELLNIQERRIFLSEEYLQMQREDIADGLGWATGVSDAP